MNEPVFMAYCTAAALLILLCGYQLGKKLTERKWAKTLEAANARFAAQRVEKKEEVKPEPKPEPPKPFISAMEVRNNVDGSIIIFRSINKFGLGREFGLTDSKAWLQIRQKHFTPSGEVPQYREIAMLVNYSVVMVTWDENKPEPEKPIQQESLGIKPNTIYVLDVPISLEKPEEKTPIRVMLATAAQAMASNLKLQKDEIFVVGYDNSVIYNVFPAELKKYEGDGA